MWVLMSGEGKTDVGLCDSDAEVCPAEHFQYGPMTVIVDQVIERRLRFSPLECRCFSGVSEASLSARAKSLKPVRLVGARTRQETGYFYKNARALACIARELETRDSDEVVAVLFRDSDGTASAERGDWADKRQSMLDGFKAESFDRGVPMIPKPKSEAWWICALKPNSDHVGAALEARSGNDDSPQSLKAELEQHWGHVPTREDLCQALVDGCIDIENIAMPSFVAFRERLEEVIGSQGVYP